MLAPVTEPSIFWTKRTGAVIAVAPMSVRGRHENYLLRRIDSRVGVIPGNPVHLVDVADALFWPNSPILTGPVRENDDVFWHLDESPKLALSILLSGLRLRSSPSVRFSAGSSTG